MNTAVATTRPAPVIRKPIRVMVVDDAIVVRRQLTRWIGDEKDMMVAACLRTGREAVEQLEACNPDVVVLDVDMPELDGISALPQLLKKKRDLVVIMASALTRRSAEISLRALSLGAADYVPKPEVALDADSSTAFRRELLDKIRSLGRRGSLLLRQRRPATAPREIKLPPQRPSVPAVRRPYLYAPAIRGVAAARASDRLLDRRAASAHLADRTDRQRDGACADFDHPAHAADFHDGARRTSDAHQRAPGARSRT